MNPMLLAAVKSFLPSLKNQFGENSLILLIGDSLIIAKFENAENPAKFANSLRILSKKENTKAEITETTLSEVLK